MLKKIIKKMVKKEQENDNSMTNVLKPKYISIEISDKCNLKCRICNQWKESNSLKKLCFKDIKKLIDELKEYYPNVILEFSGSEPLMNKELLIKSLEYAQSKNINTALSTNGVLFSEENVEALLSLGLNHISVSLDGAKPETNDYIRNFTGNFQIITGGIKRLVKYKESNQHVKTKISVTCVITNKNITELTELCNLCQQIGVDSINYNAYVLDNSYFLNEEKKPFQDEFWVKKENLLLLKEEIKKLLEIKKNNLRPMIATDMNVLQNIPDYFELKLNIQEHGCLSGFNYFHITNFGEVTVCGKGPYLNIKKKSIREIWESKEFQNTRQKVKNCKQPCLNNCFRLG